jgi:hypothetical protein
MFSRKDEDQAELEARLMAKEVDAALEYLQRFVAGESIDFHHVTRALALVAVAQNR